MALRCEVCDKKTTFGDTHMHRHSAWRFRAPRTKRTWVPNIRSLLLKGPGDSVKISICMSCYKRYQKDGVKFLVKKDLKSIKKLNLAA